MNSHEFADIIIELIKNNSNIECKNDDGMLTGIEDIEIGRYSNGDLIIVRYANGETNKIHIC